jgi:hypothetical protein
MIYNDVTFNGIEFTAITGIKVLKVDPYLPAKRLVQTSVIARTDTSKVNSAFYTKKRILVRVGASSTTRRGAEQILDTLMSFIQGEEQWLVVPQSTGTRKYLSTYTDYDVRVDGGAYIELDLYFECSDSFGYSTVENTLFTYTSSTVATRTESITLDGSAPWQAPVFNITYSALTGGSGKTVSLGNTYTGQQVDITRTWTSSDVLIIDAYNHTVTVNGINVEFSGAIPEWKKGVGSVYYQDNFTTRTFSGTLKYNKRYV